MILVNVTPHDFMLSLTPVMYPAGEEDDEKEFLMVWKMSRAKSSDSAISLSVSISKPFVTVFSETSRWKCTITGFHGILGGHGPRHNILDLILHLEDYTEFSLEGLGAWASSSPAQRSASSPPGYC